MSGIGRIYNLTDRWINRAKVILAQVSTRKKNATTVESALLINRQARPIVRENGALVLGPTRQGPRQVTNYAL
jgi:hypothetical protein